MSDILLMAVVVAFVTVIGLLTVAVAERLIDRDREEEEK